MTFMTARVEHWGLEEPLLKHWGMYELHPFRYSLFFYQVQNTLSFGPSISQSKACFPHFKVSKIIETFILFPKPGALSFCSMNTTPPAQSHTQAHEPTFSILTFHNFTFPEPDSSPYVRADRDCGHNALGLTVGLVGIVVGTIFIIKACAQVGPPDTRVPCELHPRKGR